MITRTLFTLALSLHTLSACGQSPARVLLFSEDQLPGTASGVNTIQAVGQAGTDFYVLGGIAQSPGPGVWRIDTRTGEVSLVVSPDAFAPLLGPGASVRFIHQLPRVNAAGDLAFLAYLEGPAVNAQNNDAVFRVRNGTLSLIARGGEPIEGLPHVSTVLEFNDNGVFLSGQGDVLFEISSTGPDGTRTDLMIDSPISGTRSVATRGEPVPGYSDGTTWREFIFAYGQQDRILILAAVNDTSGRFDRQGLFSVAGDGAVTPVVLPGQAAPFGPGVTHDRVRRTVLAPDGGAIFQSDLFGPGISAENDRAVVRVLPDGTQLPLAQRGDGAPGPEPGQLLGRIFTPTPLGACLDGTALVHASLSRSSAPDGSRGLWQITPEGRASPVWIDGTPIGPAGEPTRLPRADAIASANGRWAGEGSFDIGDDRFETVIVGGAGEAPRRLITEGDALAVEPGANPDQRTVERAIPIAFTPDERLVSWVLFTNQSQAIAIEPRPCPADTNNDGLLTPADFNAWILAFNTNAPECDQNGDGLCTPADFNAWILNFNAGC